MRNDVRIIDAHHRTPLEHQTILIRGGMIDQVFPDGSKSLPDSITVLDMRGRETGRMPFMQAVCGSVGEGGWGHRGGS